MSDEKALLAAIWDQPHEDTPRLVYADWLQETGEPANVARAEFIRIQCAMTPIDRWDARFAELQIREVSLWNTFREAWRSPLPERWRDSPFRRGFPVLDLSPLPIDELLTLTADDLQVAPLSRYHYAIPGEQLDAVLAWPGLRFQDLFSPRPPLADGWVGKVAMCPALRNVSELCARIPLTPAEVKMLLDAWSDRHLPNLALAGAIGDEGVAILATHPTAGKVRNLDLRGSAVSAAGLRSLGESPCLTALRGLNLRNNAFGDAGLSELVRGPLLASLRELHLALARLGDAGVSALANCPRATNLRFLELGMNGIGADGCRALARSPFLGQLADLRLNSNPGTADPAVKQELRERFGNRVRF